VPTGGIAGVVAAAWLALAAGGCLSYTGNVAAPAPAPGAVDPMLAVGRIATDRTEWERAALRLQRRLVRELGDQGQAVVQASVPRSPSAGTLVITGRLVDADPGSDLMSLLLTEWFGGPAAEADIVVADADGRVLLHFTNRVRLSARVLDPTASGPADLEAVIDELAADAAGAIWRWLAGRPYADTLF
jgi:hypothetical protein